MITNNITNNIDPSLLFVSQRVDSAITAISQKMGVATTHFYPILVRQQVIQGEYFLGCLCVLLFAIILCFGLSFYFSKKAIKIKKETGKDSGFFELLQVFTCIFTVIGLVVLIIFLFNSGDNIAKIFNPEYYALKDIVNLIK